MYMGLEDINFLGRKVPSINSTVFFSNIPVRHDKNKIIIAFSENIPFLFLHPYVIGRLKLLPAFYNKALVAQVTKLAKGSMRAKVGLKNFLAQCSGHRPHNHITMWLTPLQDTQ